MCESLLRSKGLKIWHWNSISGDEKAILSKITFRLLSDRKKSKKLFILICTLVIFINKWAKSFHWALQNFPISVVALKLRLSYFLLAHMMIVMCNDCSKYLCDASRMCVRYIMMVYAQEKSWVIFSNLWLKFKMTAHISSEHLKISSISRTFNSWIYSQILIKWKFIKTFHHSISHVIAFKQNSAILFELRSPNDSFEHSMMIFISHQWIFLATQISPSKWENFLKKILEVIN